MQIILLALPLLFCGFLAWQNHSLKSENELLNANLNIALNANESYAREFGRISDDFSAGLGAIAQMRDESAKEIRYVEKIKTQIIYDNNASCLDAINGVYSRLREQGREHQTR